MELTGRDPEADRLLAAWFAAAHEGGGTPWLTPGEAEALALYALRRGEGVRMMEAVRHPIPDAARDPDLEILGADAPGENWEDHGDPSRALTLLRRKLLDAARGGARLRYKLWLCPARGA